MLMEGAFYKLTFILFECHFYVKISIEYLMSEWVINWSLMHLIPIIHSLTDVELELQLVTSLTCQLFIQSLIQP